MGYPINFVINGVFIGFRTSAYEGWQRQVGGFGSSIMI